MLRVETEVAEKYAQALFELATEDDTLKETLQQLSQLVETVNNHDDLNQLLHHPQLTNSQKKEVLDKIFVEELSENILNFLKLLVDKQRENYLEVIYNQFKNLVDDQEDRLEVEVRSPIKLTTTNEQKLKNKLEKLTSKEISLKIEIEPALLGGLVLKIGDKVIDGSLLNHLKKMKEKLQKSEVSKLGVK